MALREILARFGFEIDNSKLKQADAGIAGVAGKLQAFGAAIAGAAVVRGIATFVKDTVAMGDELGDTAAKLGFSAQALQQWRTAVDFAGGNAQALGGAIRVLSKNAFEASKGGGAAGEAFKALGVDVKDAGGQLKSQETLLLETSRALAGVENKTERAALAQEVLGRGAQELLPLFTDGAKGLEEYLGVLEAAGGAFGEDFLEATDKADKSFKRFDLSTNILKSRIAVAFLPALTALTDGFSRLIGFISKVTAKTQIFKAALLVVGGALLQLGIARFGGQLLSLARAVALPLAKFLLLALAIDDLLTFFKGGKSVIGAGLDKIFGAGAGDATSQALRNIGGALSDLIFGTDEAEDRWTRFAATLASETDGIVNEFSEAWTRMTGDVSLAVQDWITELEQAPIGDAIATLLNIASAGLLGAAADWAQAGADMVDGLIEGIKSKAPDLALAVADVATVGALGSLKNAWESFSPSKAAMREGASFGEGLALGIGKTAGMVQKASESLATTATASLPARGGAAAPAGGVVFKSEIRQTIQGNPSPEAIASARAGLRTDLADNRRATLAALTQTVEA